MKVLTDSRASRILKRDFFIRKPEVVARDLLGKILVRKIGSSTISGRIVEVEAYLDNDEAAHGFKGKNARNQSLFKSGGHLYVHTQRHHTLLDIVAGEEGICGGVLIRAVEPIEGIELMQTNRKRQNLHELASGPGKIGEAYGITRDLDGMDITSQKGIMLVEDAQTIPQSQIGISPRIGITKAATAPLRFFVLNSPYVSRFRPIKPVGSV